MPITLRHSTQQQRQPSALSHGVGLPVTDGGLGAVSRALGQVAGAAGDIGMMLKRKEEALTRSEIEEAKQNYSLKLTQLESEMQDASDKQDFARYNEIYEEYSKLDPSSEEWDLAAYQPNPDKRKIDRKDWESEHNNIQEAYLSRQLSVRTKKTNMEFSSKLSSINKGVEDVITGLYASGNPFTETGLLSIVEYMDTPSVSAVLGALPEELKKAAEQSILSHHTGLYISAAVDHFRSANDPIASKSFEESARSFIEKDPRLSHEDREEFSIRLNDLRSVTTNNFNPRSKIQKVTKAIMYGNDPYTAAVEAKALAQEYPGNQELQEFAQDSGVFVEYARDESRSTIFAEIGGTPTYVDKEKALDKIDPSGQLSERGREELGKIVAQQSAAYHQAMQSGNVFGALSIVSPRIHDTLKSDPSNERAYHEAITVLDPSGSLDLGRIWHPLFDQATQVYNSGDPSVSVPDILQGLISSLGDEKTSDLVFNNIQSTDSDFQKAAAGMFLEQVFGIGVSKSFKDMLDDVSAGGVRARTRAGYFLDDIREDEEISGTAANILDSATGFMDTAISNYTSLLAYGFFRDNPRASEEDAVRYIGDKLKEKISVEPLSSDNGGSVAYVPKDLMDFSEFEKSNYVRIQQPGIWGTVKAAMGPSISHSEYGRRLNIELSQEFLNSAGDTRILETWGGWDKKALDEAVAAGGRVAEEIEFFRRMYPDVRQVRDLLDERRLIPEFRREGNKLVARLRFSQSEPGVPDSLRYVRDFSKVTDPTKMNEAPIVELDYKEVVRRARDISYEPPELFRRPGNSYWGLDPVERSSSYGWSMRINRFINPFY